MLSSRIRVKALQGKATSFPKKHICFYRKYASFVNKALRKPLFQGFLRWLLKREKIDESIVKDIQVRIFPFHKENGNSLAGRWNEKGQITIYPKSLKFYRRLAVEHGNETARFYVKCRAWAALIHEILHSKYWSDEKEVRRLTKKYFNIYFRNARTQNSNGRTIFEILFK